MRAEVRRVDDGYAIVVKGDGVGGLLTVLTVHVHGKRFEGGVAEVEFDKLEVVEGEAYLW